MTEQELANSFEFEGLFCYTRQLESGSFYYIPLHADLQRDTQGQPMFNLTAIGSLAYLMLTGVWQASGETLERLRQEIARRYEISDPATITLSFAPVSNVRCDLLLGDGAGQYQVLASSATSGMPPYSALFNRTLNEEQFAQAAAALQGRSGFMVLEYDASMSKSLTASGRLIPQSDSFVPWLREFLDAGPSGLRAALEEAIKDGLAVVQLGPPEDPTGRLVAKLYDRILTQASEVLPRLIAEWDQDAQVDLEIAATVVEDVRQPVRPRADLSQLQLTPERITFIGERVLSLEKGGKAVAEMGHPLLVELGFDPDGAPLAWVRLQRGGAEALLKPPHFAPMEVPAGQRGEPLRVTAGYTDGAHLYRQEIRLPEQANFLLLPHHLGLIRVSVDARPLAQADVRSAQIWLRYRPPHRPDELRQTFQFGNGTWLAQWWLAAPGESSLHYLSYRWMATTGDGRTLSEAVEQTGSSDIVLSYSGGATDVTDR